MRLASQRNLAETETISKSFDYLFILTVIGNKYIYLGCLQFVFGYDLCYIPDIVYKEYCFCAFIANSIFNDGVKETIIVNSTSKCKFTEFFRKSILVVF